VKPGRCPNCGAPATDQVPVSGFMMHGPTVCLRCGHEEQP
jgi:hypothetical protein